MEGQSRPGWIRRHTEQCLRQNAGHTHPTFTPPPTHTLLGFTLLMRSHTPTPHPHVAKFTSHTRLHITLHHITHTTNATPTPTHSTPPTHWYLEGPELSSHFAVELHSNLGGDAHQLLLLGQSPWEDALRENRSSGWRREQTASNKLLSWGKHASSLEGNILPVHDGLMHVHTHNGYSFGIKWFASNTHSVPCSRASWWHRNVPSCCWVAHRSPVSVCVCMYHINTTVSYVKRLELTDFVLTFIFPAIMQKSRPN